METSKEELLELTEGIGKIQKYVILLGMKATG